MEEYDNDFDEVNPVRYFMATPFIFSARLLAYISSVIAGFPIIILDFSELEVVPIDEDEHNE